MWWGSSLTRNVFALDRRNASTRWEHSVGVEEEDQKCEGEGEQRRAVTVDDQLVSHSLTSDQRPPRFLTFEKQQRYQVWRGSISLQWPRLNLIAIGKEGLISISIRYER